jgi:uncharacterized membrane protein YbhN (UPF0104 family)
MLKEKSEKDKSQIKRYLTTFIKVLVSSSLLYLIFSNIDKKAFIENLSMMDKLFIPLVVVFLVLNYIVSSYRWKALLIFKNSEKVSVGFLTSLYFIGSFFNNFMPTSIGGDVYKIFRLGNKISSKVNAFSATFMERFTGVIVLVLISIFSMYRYLGWHFVLLLIWSVLGFYFGFFILRTLSKKVSFIDKMYRSLMMYKNENKVLFWAILTSVIVQLLSIFTQYTIFASFGVNIPLFYALLTLPLITLASFFVPSLNGVGVQDALYVTLFGYIGISSELALSASVMYHLFRLGVSLIGGVLYALERSD